MRMDGWASPPRNGGMVVRPGTDLDWQMALRGYPWRMRSVGLEVLRNRLSEFVRLAASGETVLITDRDRVVAELIPPREGRSPELDDANFAQLVREGLITPPMLRGSGPPPRKPAMTHADLMQELRKSRGAR